MRCCSNHTSNNNGHQSGFPWLWVMLIGLGGLLVFLKWDSLAGFLPYLLLLACPLMHLLMHKSHGKTSQCDHAEKTKQVPPETSPN